MNRKVFILLLAAIFLVTPNAFAKKKGKKGKKWPVVKKEVKQDFKETEFQKNQEFREYLKTLPKEERLEARKEYRKEKRERRMEYQDKMYEGKRVQIENSRQLNEEQKIQRLEKLDKKYSGAKARYEASLAKEAASE